MLDTSLRYEFITKHSRNCTPQELFRHYHHYYFSYQNGDAHAPVESFSDCLWYIKKLVIRFRPDKLMKFLYSMSNLPYENIDLAGEYIELVNTIARIHIFVHDDYEIGVIWAKKGLDLIEYFHPVEAAFNKEYLIKHNDLYSDCLMLYQKYEEYFDENEYKDYMFNWEYDFYLPICQANDNGLKAL